MDDPRAQRTLVKSPPELWAEVSDVGALAGHLGAFGEIRITRLEPETTVAWEGDRARGTVELEPSGWGTKVTLTAQIASEPPRDPEPAAAPEPAGATEPAAEDEVEPVESAEPAAPVARAERSDGQEEPAPEPVRVAPQPPQPASLDAGRAQAILAGVLDDLGAARHRPFSRG